MIIVRCKECNTEICSNTKTQVCGCPNMMTVLGDKVSAQDLSKIVMINSDKKKSSNNVLLIKILQIKRREENVKFVKLDFEVR